ncbi:MAG: flagellar export protein FliJ [Treponema sp.]|jgi:flagellar FliJ protein|nr:flagellar export protein FliJ [Treponema sp.]
MRRFQFSLEKILELKAYREQETELALGRAVGELSAIENRLKELALLSRRAWDEYRNPQAPAASGNLADYYRSCDLYIRRLDQTKEELLQEAAQAQARVEQARAVFLEASRERKVLDKLKEKRAGEYRKTLLAAETRILDDMVKFSPSTLA